MAPIIFTNITSKKSLLGLGWTIVTCMSIVAFMCAGTMTGLIHSHFNARVDMYANYDAYYNNESGDKQSNDNEIYEYLASVSSKSINFSFIYILGVTLALGLYGGLFVVGFMYPNGKYAPPLFSTSSHNLKINYGIFTSVLVMFSNLCLITSFILSKVRVNDMRDNREREDVGGYAIEKIAVVLSVMFIFLTVLHFTFSIVLLCLKSVIVEADNEEEKPRTYYPPRLTVSNIS